MKTLCQISTMAFFILTVLIPTKNALSDSQQNKVKFHREISKIDVRYGTPNHPHWTLDDNVILYFTHSNKSGYTLWHLSPTTLEAKSNGSKIQSSTISPDGKTVTYITNHQLHIASIESGALTKLALPNDFQNSTDAYSLNWSPDGRFLSLYSVAAFTTRIWLFDINTKSFKKVTDVVNTSSEAPDPHSYNYLTAWSPDSQSILLPVFSNERVDYLITGLHKSNTKKIEGLQNVALAEPSWTSKNYILWYGYDKSKKVPKSDSADFSGIYIANVGTGKMTNLDFTNVASAWYPVLSPDARWIVFYAKDGKNKSKLMLTDVEGSFVEVLDESITPGQAPKWSHDSKRIVYNKLLDSGAITLGLITISPSTTSK